MQKNRLTAALAALFLCFGSFAAERPEGTDVFTAGEAGIHTYRIPALLMTRKGTILAFAEARHNSKSDTGDIDLVVKRSTDGGKSWSESLTVWDDSGNVCGNPCPVVDRRTGRIVLLMTWNNGEDIEKQIKNRTSIDTRRVFCTYSDDDGLSWSKPKEITRRTKDKEWTWYATGPCHALQTTTGRIVIPCNHGLFIDGEPSGYSSHVIYSDNGGKRWKMGGDIGSGNESTIAECSDGSLLINLRDSYKANPEENKNVRLAARSFDGGKTFTEAWYEYQLIEPRCQGSLINAALESAPSSLLLFSNPRCKNKRSNMTVMKSADNGETWEEAMVVDEGLAAYSDLVILENGDAGILYETGEKSAYEKIVFKVVPAEAFR